MFKKKIKEATGKNHSKKTVLANISPLRNVVGERQKEHDQT